MLILFYGSAIFEFVVATGGFFEGRMFIRSCSLQARDCCSLASERCSNFMRWRHTWWAFPHYRTFFSPLWWKSERQKDLCEMFGLFAALHNFRRQFIIFHPPTIGRTFSGQNVTHRRFLGKISSIENESRSLRRGGERWLIIFGHEIFFFWPAKKTFSSRWKY